MKKFTLIELLVVIAIIAIIFSILLPNMSKSREKAKLLVCGGDKKQQYTLMFLHTVDQNGLLPNFNGYYNRNPSGDAKIDDWYGAYDRNGRLRDGVIFQYNKKVVLTCPSKTKARIGSGEGSNGNFDTSSAGAFAKSKLRSISNRSRRYPAYNEVRTPMVVEESAATLNRISMEGEFSNGDSLDTPHMGKGSYIAVDGGIEVYMQDNSSFFAMKAIAFSTFLYKHPRGWDVWETLNDGTIPWHTRKALRQNP